ncbi:MAG TPA: glucose 1-dehydrogenase [Chloroflexota bacterium]|nr:glucose 1-dehydrogenase [Chloroflexota bacterium]
MRLEGKVALVTGAGSGIGRAIAVRLAGDGARIVAADLNPEGATETISKIEAAGGSGSAVQVDVRDVSSLQAMVDGTVERFGRIDILVACAGIVQTKRMRDITPEDWDRIFSVNSRGLFFTMQLVSKQMERQGSGVILNMSSAAARGPRPMYTHYAASKAAVISITRSAAASLAPSGVRVNAICPGIVETPMWDQIDREYAAESGRPLGEHRRQRAKEIPLGRLETAEDVASAAAFLVSDDASYITGQTLNVDGGINMD